MENSKLPYISVIITAYNRKEFLLNAIKSAVNQTLDKKIYEIIVITNFEDEDIDRFINENKIKHILMQGTLGEFLYKGISEAMGEIVSFLDDDDLFTKDKLQILYEQFMDNNICYYHNSHLIVNDEYHEYDSNMRKSPVFNMSSISVRKSILNLDTLKKININPDDFMYLSALDSGKNIITDNKKLTYYMRHNSISQIETKNIDKFIEISNKYSQMTMDSFKLFDALFISKDAKNYIKQRITEVEIREYLFGNKTKPKNALNIFEKSDTTFSSKLKHYLAYLLIRIHYNFRYLIIKEMANHNTHLFDNNDSGVHSNRMPR